MKERIKRYFYEEIPYLYIIAAGSLLDHTLNWMKYSMSVGRLEFAYMYPMNFSEFLFVVGEKALVHFIENFKIGNSIAEAIHEKLLALLHRYFFIGRMPEAVSVYAGKNNTDKAIRFSINTPDI